MPRSHDARKQSGATAEIRCAIYTRKSTEEGLDQQFNSLDAQREACAAYILSMKHEGWRALPGRYDDGGCSGGNMSRPALQELLRDVKLRKIDVVVIYKIDRLTRSLMDFGKIVEKFDAAKVSFVSVTQSFNTQTSMGRLTLNMLLSFAQFERELGSERVRDKIAASKAKGMWTGGTVPLGYDVHNRKLEINPKEAEQVRLIFETYVELRSVRQLIHALAVDGVVTKTTPLVTGKVRGGVPFRRGCLYHLLRNETYLGLTRHKGRTFPGQHRAIIDVELWRRVQATLQENAVDRMCAASARVPSLFAGIISDCFDRRMTPSHTQKPNKRYRYYVSSDDEGAEAGGAKVALMRVPAEDLEKLVCSRIRRYFAKPDETLQLWKGDGLTAIDIADRINRIRAFSREFARKTGSALRKLILSFCQAVIVGENEITVRINKLGLQTLLGFDASGLPQEMTISCKARRSVPNACLILLPDKSGKTANSRPLLDHLGKAYAARQVLEADEDRRRLDGPRRRYLVKMAKFAFLAPDIVTAILKGHQPAQLTAERLRRISRLPSSWDDQRRLLGFVTADSAPGVPSH
jgi:DNA invertase Pin-like site-specific DNA recombinase